MQTYEYQLGRVFMGNVDHDADLLHAIENFMQEKGIKTAQVRVIGAVKTAVVAFYDQDKQLYIDDTFDQQLEIMSCIGNISLREGKPVGHLHVVFSDENGETLAGHLRPGTIVFSGEIFVQELLGPELHRGFNPLTGLPSWMM